MNVAIVGAGYAGMAAAVTLSQAGVPVTVYEAATLPGGRARRITVHGTRLDNGIHILIGAYRETLALIRTVGGAPDASLLRLPLDWRIHDAFRLRTARLPSPWHLAAGVLTAHGAAWSERLAAARFFHAARKDAFRLREDCTVAALLARHGQGAAFTRHLWTPLCLAALNTPPERASAQVFLHVLRDALDAERAASDVLLARSDLSALFPEPAADYVRRQGGEVRLRTAVREIESDDGRFRVTTTAGTQAHTHVICATSPHHVPALAQSLPALREIVDGVSTLHYEPIYTVYLQYAEPVRLPYLMLGLADSTAHWVFDRDAISGQPGLVAAVISAGGAHTAIPHATLAQRVHEDLVRAFGSMPPLSWHQVVAEKRATFACTAHVARPQSVTPLPGFLLAGDYVHSDYPGTLEAAVRSGTRAAHAILH